MCERWVVRRLWRKKWAARGQADAPSLQAELDRQLQQAENTLEKEKADAEETRRKLTKRRGEQDVEDNWWIKKTCGGYDAHEPCEKKALRKDIEAIVRGYSVRMEADPAEMLVVDIDPRNRSIQKTVYTQMSVMKSRQGESIERTTQGFAALEGELLDAAWDDAALYRENMETHELRAAWLDVLTNVFNVLIVFIVVAKQWWYPNANGLVAECEREGDLSPQEQQTLEGLANYNNEAAHNLMTGVLIIMPIVNGVFITLKSQTDPHTKSDALAWADAALESETYMYRSRSLHYSRVTNTGWHIDRLQ
eukprot:COSAG02_NODE_13691_length_1361_cov_1.803487_1_plen_306_part_10